jgi:hypothetical protein
MVRLSRSRSVEGNRIDIELNGELIMRAVSPAEATAFLSKLDVDDPAKLVEHVLVWGEVEIHKHA